MTRVQLDTGLLEVDVLHTQLPLSVLCDFATRRNPKRGFLFVSRVLGRHMPATPRAMSDIYNRLARQISTELPGPVLFIGMAETAVCLGHGVYAEYAALSGRDDTLFLHTTRYHVNRTRACDFAEEHSHATEHIIYTPQSEADQKLLRSVRSVVLVDDEASSGKTFVNLAGALRKRYPTIENVVTAVITDWRGEEKIKQNRSSIHADYQPVSVLSGKYGFTPAPNLQSEPMPNVTGNGRLKDELLSANYGRFGIQSNRLLHDMARQKADNLSVRTDERVLVLGTGEFVYPPFVLAQELEARGSEVYCQATTRSPVRLGGAVQSMFEFRDNYDDGIPNFIYNARSEDYDRVIICHETPHGSVDPALVEHFRAELVKF